MLACMTLETHGVCESRGKGNCPWSLSWADKVVSHRALGEQFWGRHSCWSITRSCPNLCDPMDSSTPGPHVHRHSRSLPKLMSIESVMPSSHLVLCHPLYLLTSIFTSFRVFSKKKSQLFTSGGQSIGASASVLPMNIQGWFPLELTDLISLLPKVLLPRVFSSTTVRKHQFFWALSSLWSNSHIHPLLLEKP